MQKNTTPEADEQALITLHDGTQVSADTLTVTLNHHYATLHSLALEADTVEDYYGDHILADDAITFTHGKHEGERAHEDDAIALLGDGYCHSSDDYTTTYNGDKCYAGEESEHGLVFAADTEDWHAEDDCTSCIVGGHSRRTAEHGYVYAADYTYCESDDNHYWDAVLSDFDIEEHGDSGDFYFLHDMPEDENAGNAEYHCLDRRDKTTNATRFTVGFEVEKEDGNARSIHYREVYDNTGWVKESDGSLSDERGYELVTPVFDLMTDALDLAIAGSADLRTLLNADYSSACGGHINFGITGQDGQQVCDATAGWFPLLYAMFPSRARTSRWSKAYKLNDTKLSTGGKYSAVAVHEDRIEFRVFSAVRNVKNLLWRRDLIRLIARSIGNDPGESETGPVAPASDPTQVLGWALDQEHALHRHLRAVYTEAALLELVGRAVEMYHALEEDRITLTVAFANSKDPAQLTLPGFSAPIAIPVTLEAA